MDKIILKCDVCGSPLTMQSGGQSAACEYCGMQYAIPRLREKIQEIRGTVSVEGVVKTASADFDIQAGVLLHYRGKDTVIVVPEGVNEIGESCFRGMQYLTSITLPEGLVCIAFSAFSGCSGLTQINIPQGVKEIGASAFSGCSGLTQINIPQGVKEIGASAFSGCSGLKQLSIPDSITEIGENAFGKCTGLTHISLPKGLVKIGDDSFSGCSGLEQITIPDSVSEIGVCAFYNCSKLTQISLPYHLQLIGEQAFGGCGKIESVTGISTDYFYNNISIKRYRDRDSEGCTYSCDKWFVRIFCDCPLLRSLLRPIYRKEGKCQYCGGNFEGLFTKRCRNCHRIKDY